MVESTRSGPGRRAAPGEALEAVVREIGVSLGAARAAVETFIEQPENPVLLNQCAEELGRVCGVLRVIQLNGAALLADEMRTAAGQLAAGEAGRQGQSGLLESLLRALAQLPNYVERVTAGGRDVPLVLLPLLNDLRAARGMPLVTEGTLMVLDVTSDAAPQPSTSDFGQPSVTELARRLRPRFQQGLVGWIRGEQSDHLAALADVAAQIEQAAKTKPVYQLWWVMGAVLEALADKGIEDGVAVKRLVGLGDRELRRLQDEGEDQYAQSPAEELQNNLLFHVGHATSQGPRVTAVRTAFRLGEVLPSEAVLEQERDNLAAPSLKLLHTVAAAIREDLARVKDVLDICQRRDASAPEELASQLLNLRRIGDTLGVLGLGEQRGVVMAQVERLEPLVASSERPPEGLLVDVAAKLIAIEDRLDSELAGTVAPRRHDTAIPASDVDFQQVQSAVLRECMVNLAQVKQLVAQGVGGTIGTDGPAQCAMLLAGMGAALKILDKPRAMNLCTRIADRLSELLRPGHPTASEPLEWIADAIVSLEYYMETLQAGRADPWYMLDNADAALRAASPQALSAPLPAPLPTEASVEEPISADAPTLEAPVVEALAPEAPLFEGPTVKVPVLELPVSAPVDVDPELLSIFLEESREEVERIGTCFRAWDQNPQDQESLRTLRRSFHTLKGSGRVVGARDMHEFAWAIEELLNHVIEGSVPRTPQVMDTLREAVRVMPQLVAQLADGTVPHDDLAGIRARAQALAAGQPLQGSPSNASAAVATLESDFFDDTPTMKLSRVLDVPAEAVEPAAALPLAAPIDQQLRDIYVRETDSHIAVVEAFLDRAMADPRPCLLPEPVYRACHTLAGSSRAAEARHGIRLAQPLDHWLCKAFDAGVELQFEDWQLVGDCMAALRQVSRHLDESTGFFQSHDVLRLRIAAAEADLERRIAHHALPAEPVVEPVVETPAEPVPEATLVEDFDFSPEIASVFGDEATELLESVQHAMSGIDRNVAPESAITALKRPLHTLKGGARLAGIFPMGDLAHEVESLITRVELGQVRWGAEAHDALQTALDELSRMRDLVVAGDPVPVALALITRLQDVGSAPAAVAASEPVPTVVVEGAPAVAPQAPHETPVEVATEAAAPVVEAALPEPLAAVPEPPAPAAVVPPAPFVAPAAPAAPPRAAFIAPPVAVPMDAAQAREAATVAVEMARVDPELLDQMLNLAGEVSVGRARVEQQLGLVDFNLGELARTVTRLKEQLRKLEMETEAQILHRHESDTSHRTEFDPLELDRYSSIQQFSRGLAETASDVASIQQLLETMTRDTQTLLQQQGRAVVEMQNGLMRTRMVSFQRHLQRLSRIVRQAAGETQKQAELVIEGAEGEFDRQVLERMLPPIEHMLRNAVVHGIEAPDVRRAAGKPEAGRITLSLRREGAEVMLVVADDGAGMDLAAIRAKGVASGLLRPTQQLSDEALMQLVLEPGFSTASTVTQVAGRGVGMDVVATEIKRLGGSLQMETVAGRGTRFAIRLPFTLAVSQALVVRIGEECYALPLPTVEGVVRLPAREIAGHLGEDAAPFVKGGHSYRLQPLGSFVGAAPPVLQDPDVMLPVVLVRAGEQSTGLVADELIGSREIVVKNVGPQLGSIRGISGATILGDGRIAIILDISALLRAEWRNRALRAAVPDVRVERPVLALVVDDSITVRRVTQRLLERNGMRVLTARDGMDALAVMQEQVPDIILLDIEMPRMDGYEVAAQVRADPRTQDVPIVMITSRVGDKHRARATELGVDDYVGKPYQEGQLLAAMMPLLERRFRALGLPPPVVGA